MRYSKFPKFHACTGQIALLQQLPHRAPRKQLSAFIRKVGIFASGYVGLIHYWICLLITTIVFPILELVHIFLNAVNTQDLGK